jgi:thiol-disulfide isomerase/thioredoxin
MKKLGVLVSILLGGLLLAACFNTSKSNVPRAPLKVLMDAPEFQIKNVQGGEPISSKDFKGKILVVDFWATWCVPCKVEVPEYNRIRAKLKDRGVEFLGVTFESTVDDTKEFVKEFEMLYPVGIATDEIDVAFGGHRGFPTTFLIGKDGKVYRNILGSPNGKIANLEKDIEELLALSATY